MTITDIHTHNPNASGAIYSLPSPAASVPAGCRASLALHPWESDRPDADKIIEAIERRIHSDKNIVAIGETGLDKLRGAPLTIQEHLLRRHIILSELTGLPLILHIVGAWSEILRIKKEVRPNSPWIIHGFRGKPALARQLLDAGFYLSLGQHYNPSTATMIPSDRMLIESDEADSTPVPPSHYDSALPSKLFRASNTSPIEE